MNLLAVYRNSPDVISFCKVLAYEFSIHECMVVWQYSDHWYVPARYVNGVISGLEKHPGGLEKHPAGLSKHPSCYLETLTEYTVLNFETHAIAYKGNDTGTINNWLMLIEAFAGKLYQNFLLEQKNKIFTSTVDNIVQVVKKSIDGNLLDMTNEILDCLDLAYVDLGLYQEKNTIFNLHELLQNLSHVTNFYIEDTVPQFVFGDAYRIKQLVLNLSKRLVKGSTLVISAQLVDIGAEAGIENNGDQSYSIDLTISQTVNLSRTTEHLVKNLSGSITRGKNTTISFIVAADSTENLDNSTLKSLKDKHAVVIGQFAHRAILIKTLKKFKMQITVCDSYDEYVMIHIDRVFDCVFCLDDRQFKWPTINLSEIQLADEAVYKQKILTKLIKKKSPLSPRHIFGRIFGKN